MYTHEPGLAIMKMLMERLGNPQEHLNCVHIAGTNGKGSCAAMVASVLQAAGYKTGLFTSPDLTDISQRIQINGVNINSLDFTAVTQSVKMACMGLPEEPSFFEKITAAALSYFAIKQCEFVVLEAGLGGRLDATNIIIPRNSVITSIGLDHTKQLGSTLAEIAREKCGIIKPERVVLTVPQDPEAMAVIEQEAHKAEDPLVVVDINEIQHLENSLDGQRFSYLDLEDVYIPLLGEHQVLNACVAITQCWLLGMKEPAIRQGLEQVKWPCRFEYFKDCTPPVVIDGAHNGLGAAALAAGLENYFPDKKFTLIMGVMGDKDYDTMLSALEPLAQRVICLTPDSPRALPAQELAGHVKTVPALTADSVSQALALAKTFDDPICAFGSLYYVGLLRQMLTEE